MIVLRRSTVVRQFITIGIMNPDCGTTNREGIKVFSCSGHDSSVASWSSIDAQDGLVKSPYPNNSTSGGVELDQSLVGTGEVEITSSIFA